MVQCPECDKVLKTVQGARAHQRQKHEKSDTILGEKDTGDLGRLASTIQEGFKGIETRLGKVETDVGDVCSRFPELCQRVESIEKGIARFEPGSEEWKSGRMADLDHMLFGDCHECTPI
jgi:hypothetical protein